MSTPTTPTTPTTSAGPAINIANQTGTRYLSSDWNNRCVSYNPHTDQFTIYSDLLSTQDIINGFVTLNVKLENDPTGSKKAENEKWKSIKVEFAATNETSLNPSSKKDLSLNLGRIIEEIDPKKEIYKTLAAKYQKIFTDYSRTHAEYSSRFQSKVFPPASHVQKFAEFEHLNDPPKDVVFKIDRSEEDRKGEKDCDYEVKAHEFVLIAASSKFMEKLINQKEINLNRFSVETIQKFVSYLYTKQVNPANSAETLELYQLAKNFEISHLKQLCIKGAYEAYLAMTNPKSLTDLNTFNTSIRDQTAEQMIKFYETTTNTISTFASILSENLSDL